MNDGSLPSLPWGDNLKQKIIKNQNTLLAERDQTESTLHDFLRGFFSVFFRETHYELFFIGDKSNLGSHLTGS